ASLPLGSPRQTHSGHSLTPSAKSLSNAQKILEADEFSSTEDRHAHCLSSNLCRRNSKVVPVDQHTTTQYRSASNSLLARTADKTPMRDPKDARTPKRSQSINTFKVFQHSLTP
ncbi:hypothetical protein AVEN_118523-1, partial [Araneus ventricosus]